MALRCITSTTPVLPALFDTAASRAVEAAVLASSPPFSLMAQAGTDVARLALAMAPHAGRIWVLAGPGNNGGDGVVAATALHRAGRQVHLTRLGDAARAPADAQQALQLAHAAGLAVSCGLPAGAPDLIIDALLGLGQHQAPAGEVAELVQQINRTPAPVLAVDLPTGLCADSGQPLGASVVRADVTLALLTLKPGLFTGQGRDATGQLWWSDLGVALPPGIAPTARLTGPTQADRQMPLRPHAAHKGSQGDAWIIGGTTGMEGAAHLAGRAALAAGAGRVYLGLLGAQAPATDPQQAELMHRTPEQWRSGTPLGQATVACGCGGGDAVRAHLPTVLHHAARLVLDADALNAVAANPALMQALKARGRRGQPTVLTPHPLEAARLMGLITSQVQAQRLAAARQLADHTGAVVVLKGSGTVVAAPGEAPTINPSGNARLATAGSGDVLAGWLAGLWAQQPDASGLTQALAVARATVWLHGRAAEVASAEAGALRLPLPAGQLIGHMVQTAARLA